jgi:hypothetical protein
VISHIPVNVNVKMDSQFLARNLGSNLSVKSSALAMPINTSLEVGIEAHSKILYKTSCSLVRRWSISSRITALSAGRLAQTCHQFKG